MGVYDGFGAMMGTYYGNLGASQGYSQAQQTIGNQQAQMMDALFSVAGANAKRQQWEQEQEARRRERQAEMDYRNQQLQLERDRILYGQQREGRMDALALALQGLDPNMTPTQIAVLRAAQMEEGMKMGKYGPNGMLVRERKPRSIEDSKDVARLYEQLYSGSPQDQATAAAVLKDQGEDPRMIGAPTGGGVLDRLGASFQNIVSGDPSVVFKAKTGYVPQDFDKRLNEIHQFKQYAESVRGTPADNAALWKRVAEAHAEEKRLEHSRNEFKQHMAARASAKSSLGSLWDMLSNTPVGNRGPLNFF